MNAPLSVNMEQIEVYRDILPNDFIEKTVARQKLIQGNKEDSLKSMQEMKRDCNTISDKLGDLMGGLEEGVSSFEKLEYRSREGADAFLELSARIREFSENLKTQSQMIKRNMVL